VPTGKPPWRIDMTFALDRRAPVFQEGKLPD
jgi:hypothetical protein